MIGKIIGVIIGLAIFSVIGLVVMGYVTYTNKEVTIRNQMGAQTQVIEANFDKMWKTLKTQAGITDKAKESFKEIYIPLIEGRYSNGNGKMMMWIKEQNPQFDQSIFAKLMTSVEALRMEFFYEQKKLISLSNSHNNILMTIPSKWFLSGIEKIEIKVISSDITKDIMSTGKENNIDIFE